MPTPGRCAIAAVVVVVGFLLAGTAALTAADVFSDEGSGIQVCNRGYTDTGKRLDQAGAQALAQADEPDRRPYAFTQVATSNSGLPIVAAVGSAKAPYTKSLTCPQHIFIVNKSTYSPFMLQGGGI